MRNPRNETVTNCHCRHAGPVPASTPLQALRLEARWMPARGRHDGSRERLKAKTDGEIVPMRIGLLDQILFVVTRPFLDSLFRGDGGLHGFGHVKPGEAIDTVAFGEAAKRASAVLEDPTDQVRGHANVQRAVEPVRHDVNAGLAFPHIRQSAARWMPGQARHDDWRVAA